MKKINILVSALTVIPVLLLILLYKEIPQIVPRQWGFNGEPTSFMSKQWLFVLTPLPVIILLLFNIIPKIDPKKESYKLHNSSYKTVILAVSLFLIAFNIISIMKYRVIELDMKVFIGMSVGILLIIIGNLTPRFRHNYTLGIRLPWTLASEFVWTKVHRIGGTGFIILGIVIGISSFLPGILSYFISGISLLTYLVFIVLYSYALFKNEQNKA